MARTLPFHHSLKDSSDAAEFQPYLVTRLMPAVYNGEILSPSISEEEMLEVAERRSATTGLRVCLVLSPSSCVYVEPDGTARRSDRPPRSSVFI